jgi:FkbM family methyltransferase
MTAPFPLLQAALPERIRLVDVGAFRGDFTAAALAAFPGSSALLFEPGPSKAAALRERYRGQAAVRVFEVALGDESGDALLHEQEDSATDSLLPANQATGETTRLVRVSRLDAVLDDESAPPVDLIKIDTQGYDLRVLRGATETLARCHPALMVEGIFAPLYRGQASFDALLAFLTEAGYRLAGVHAIHTDPRGLLAFADFLFLWRDAHARLAAAARGPFTCRDPDVLLEQIDALQTACDERLALIHELTRAADERLALVQRLDGELRRRQEA